MIGLPLWDVELGTINMYSPKKNCHIKPSSPRNGHLSTAATLFCPQVGHGRELH